MPDNYIQLTGLSPKVQGLRWESDQLLRIGRQPTAEVVLQDTSIERLHVEIKFLGQRWVARPLTDNPFYLTQLNDLPLPDKGATLRLNDVLQIGNLAFRITALGCRPQEDLPTLPFPEGATKSLRPVRPTARTEAAPPAPPAPPIPPRAAAPADAGKPAHEEPTRPGFLVVTGVHSRPQAGLASGLSQPSATTAGGKDLQVLRVEANTRRSWEQALEYASAALRGLNASGRPLPAMLHTSHQLSTLPRLEDLLQGILADALPALGAQRAAILLTDPTTERLDVRARLAPHPSAARHKGYSRTLAERCFRQGESILCRDLRAEQDPSAARSAMVGSMSSIICALLRTSRRSLGVLHLDRGPLDEPFTEADLHLADALAASVAVGIEVAQQVQDQSDHFLQTLTTLARVVELRDPRGAEHTRRVTELALLLADDLKVPAAERHLIEVGTPLHDVGEIDVDDAVLRKPGKLTPEEFELVKAHTVRGAAMLEGFQPLASIIPIIRHHHERWDGTGYPDGLPRDRIALPARIVAVADAFDAMTSDRPYRPAMPTQLAFLELLSKAGAHFDPNVVQAFVRLRPRVEAVLRPRPSPGG